MDPRKKWMDLSNVKKRKLKRRRPPQTINLPDNFWDEHQFTEIYDDDIDFRIQNLRNNINEARNRNTIFRNEINDIMGIDIVQGAHNRNNRIHRGNQIIRHMNENDDLINEWQLELDELNDDLDDISSVPRR